jgi:hypothetical protein
VVDEEESTSHWEKMWCRAGRSEGGEAAGAWSGGGPADTSRALPGRDRCGRGTAEEQVVVEGARRCALGGGGGAKAAAMEGVVVIQWMCREMPGRREGQKAGGRIVGRRDHVLNLAHVDYGSGMICDIDVVVVLGADWS